VLISSGTLWFATGRFRNRATVAKIFGPKLAKTNRRQSPTGSRLKVMKCAIGSSTGARAGCRAPSMRRSASPGNAGRGRAAKTFSGQSRSDNLLADGQDPGERK